MRATTIVGYTFNADQYHPRCVLERVVPEDLADLGSTEMVLNYAAEQAGVDRDDEGSFDSDDFPKVILASQVESDDEVCGGCGEALL